MPILNAKVVIDTHDFQVSFMGVKTGQVTTRDISKPWLSRGFLAGLRADDDSIGFDMTTISGKRVRINYDGTVAVDMPVNNNAAIADLHKTTTYNVYSLSGMAPTAAIDAMIAKNEAHQVIWRNIADIKAKLANGDISSTQVTTLAGELASAEEGLFDVNLSLSTGLVAFSEGNGCSVTRWVSGEYADFKFEFIEAA